MTKARQIMTRNPVTCLADASLADAARLMWEHDIGMLPVTDGEGCVIAAITDRDMAMAAYIQGKPLCEIAVSSAMSNRALTVEPETSLRVVESMMVENQIRRVPVVDEDGRAVGIVCLADLAVQAADVRNAAVDVAGVAATLRAVSRPRTPELVSAAE
jgi:CBS domain-containing protein